VSKDKGGLGLAPLEPTQPVQTLAGCLERADFAVGIYEDYRSMKWSKLLLNIVNNATSAILNLTPAEIVDQPSLLDLEIEAVYEGVAVMKAQDIDVVKLPGYPVDWLARVVSARLPKTVKRTVLRPFMLSGRGTKMPSLYIDLAAGRSVSEVEVLNGAIVAAGQKFGVNTPVNQVLTSTLSGLVSGELNWDDYQHQPERLLQAVATAEQGLS
jgi:2-dehydropantoate 2-reductase